MELKEIENALNELIKTATESGGFVWIVDKKCNDFALRVLEPVKLRAFMPSNGENTEDKE